MAKQKKTLIGEEDAGAKPSMTVKDAEPKLTEKDLEIQRLRAQLAEYEARSETTAQEDLNHLADVARQASELGVRYVENFHPTVFLYKELGDKIGPYHPETAQDIVKRWAKKGFRLYLRPRTPEQIESYKKSDLYKQRMEEHKKKRERMDETSKRGIKKMAKEIGVAVAEGIRVDRSDA